MNTKSFMKNIFILTASLTAILGFIVGCNCSVDKSKSIKPKDQLIQEDACDDENMQEKEKDPCEDVVCPPCEEKDPCEGVVCPPCEKKDPCEDVECPPCEKKDPCDRESSKYGCESQLDSKSNEFEAKEDNSIVNAEEIEDSSKDEVSIDITDDKKEPSNEITRNSDSEIQEEISEDYVSNGHKSENVEEKDLIKEEKNLF